MRMFRSAVVVTLSIVLVAPALAASAHLVETGSTLLYPLMSVWASTYRASTPDVQIDTAGTGSGAGIRAAITGDAQIGASDAFLPDAQMKKTPLLNIPLVVSAQQINYNIPELSASDHLRLSGAVLTGIYSGEIHYWDDNAIKSINPTLASKLPHQVITPIHRSDGSGDTFIFTSYLSDTTPSWKSGPGFGTTVNWPAVAGAVGANGNTGMIQACQGAKYSIAYIGISYIDDTNKAGLGYAMLQNKAGNFVLPTEASIKAAASALDAQTPKNEIISLIDAPGANSYPIINYEYVIIKPDQANADQASALKAFLNWTIAPDGGNAPKYLNQVHFVALPPSVVNLSKAQIAQIK